MFIVVLNVLFMLNGFKPFLQKNKKEITTFVTTLCFPLRLHFAFLAVVAPPIGQLL